MRDFRRVLLAGALMLSASANVIFALIIRSQWTEKLAQIPEAVSKIGMNSEGCPLAVTMTRVSIADQQIKRAPSLPDVDQSRKYRSMAALRQKNKEAIDEKFKEFYSQEGLDERKIALFRDLRVDSIEERQRRLADSLKGMSYHDEKTDFALGSTISDASDRLFISRVAAQFGDPTAQRLKSYLSQIESRK